MKKLLSPGLSYRVFFHLLRRLLEVWPLHHGGLCPRPPLVHRAVPPPLHVPQHWQHLLFGAATEHRADPPAAPAGSPRRLRRPAHALRADGRGSRRLTRVNSNSNGMRGKYKRRRQNSQGTEASRPLPSGETLRSFTSHTQSPHRPGTGRWLGPGPEPPLRSQPADSAGPSPGPAALFGRCLPSEDGRGRLRQEWWAAEELCSGPPRLTVTPYCLHEW